MRDNRSIWLIFGGIIIIIMVWNSFSSKHIANSAFSTQQMTQVNSAPVPVKNQNVVPWDYKITEHEVGSLIGGDMVLLPGNQELPNDNNYATGDKIWVLSYMSADISPSQDGHDQLSLSAWQPIKSFKTQADAEKDMKNLKEDVKTDVDLIGVYKTEYEGKYREFAVIKLPSGHEVKQPIEEQRYEAFKKKTKVSVIVEEVHDYEDYNMAMAKFRGWAQ